MKKMVSTLLVVSLIFMAAAIDFEKGRIDTDRLIAFSSLFFVILLIVCIKMKLKSLCNDKKVTSESSSTTTEYPTNKRIIKNFSKKKGEDYKMNPNLRNFAYKITSDLKKFICNQCDNSKKRHINVSGMFFFPVFKSQFDMMLDKVLHFNTEIQDDKRMKTVLKEDYAFTVLAAMLILNNRMLYVVYSKKMQNQIKLLAKLPINKESYEALKCAADKIVRLLDRKNYSVSNDGELTESILGAFDMCMEKYYGILDICSKKDLDKIESKDERDELLEGISQLNYFKYYSIYDSCEEVAHQIDLASNILNACRADAKKEGNDYIYENGLGSEIELTNPACKNVRSREIFANLFKLLITENNLNFVERPSKSY